MTHAIFTIKAGSGYDDVPEEKYHFPAQYLSRVRQAIGDLIVYYEPRRGDGRLSYIAVARVDQVEADATRDGHYYARISDYLNFDRPVSFRNGAMLFESTLHGQGKSGLSGEFRNAVRLLEPHEFEAIIAAGFATPRLDASPLPPEINGLHEEAVEFQRPIIEQVVRRPFREAAFSRQVNRHFPYGQPIRPPLR